MHNKLPSNLEQSTIFSSHTCGSANLGGAVGFAQVSLGPCRYLSISTTSELAHECSFEGTGREPSESNLKCTGPLGAGLLTDTPPLLPRSIDHTKFVSHHDFWAKPKSTGERCTCKLEWRIETIIDLHRNISTLCCQFVTKLTVLFDFWAANR